MKLALRSFAAALIVVGGASFTDAEDAIALGSRRELFVDSFLIEKFHGEAALRPHAPEPGEVVFIADQPWEGNTSAYFTIFQDGDLFRMYYRGSHFDETTRKAAHREVTCYAESRDGIHWTKPELGLFEFDGSKKNNIVWDGPGTHCFTPFRDDNPACPPESKYKAISIGKPHGLYAFHSADGVHWQRTAETPVITKGAFDSQNLAFWDPHLGKYREYHRGFREGVRDIMTSTSDDFLTWTEPQFLEYPNAPNEHLYTNAIRNYERAPHLLLGFPTRFLPKTEQVEPIFMSSRDGQTFHRWPEPIIPITAPENRDGNRSNYMTWGLVQLPGDEQRISVYATEAYYTGPASRVRQFTYRVDGFASVHAGQAGGEFVTRPFTFDGKKLALNFLTGDGGEVRLELQDTSGTPLERFRLTDCGALQGDSLDRVVQWAGGGDLAALAGEPVRLRVSLKNADLFSFRFQE